jgi:hypothetical protein
VARRGFTSYPSVLVAGKAAMALARERSREQKESQEQGKVFKKSL